MNQFTSRRVPRRATGPLAPTSAAASGSLRCARVGGEPAGSSARTTAPVAARIPPARCCGQMGRTRGRACRQRATRAVPKRRRVGRRKVGAQKPRNVRRRGTVRPFRPATWTSEDCQRQAVTYWRPRRPDEPADADEHAIELDLYWREKVGDSSLAMLDLARVAATAQREAGHAQIALAARLEQESAPLHERVTRRARGAGARGARRAGRACRSADSRARDAR